MKVLKPNLDYLSSMPTELQARIYSLLEQPDQICLALTCKLFGRVAATVDLNVETLVMTKKSTNEVIPYGDNLRRMPSLSGGGFFHKKMLMEQLGDWMHGDRYVLSNRASLWPEVSNPLRQPTTPALFLVRLPLSRYVLTRNLSRLCADCHQYQPTSKEYWFNQTKYQVKTSTSIYKWAKGTSKECPKHYYGLESALIASRLRRAKQAEAKRSGAAAA